MTYCSLSDIKSKMKAARKLVGIIVVSTFVILLSVQSVYSRTNTTIATALQRIDTRSRQIIQKRSNDYFDAGDGLTVDLYRINEVRELCAKHRWDRIPVDECAALGMGHISFGNPKRMGSLGDSFAPLSPMARYEALPDLATVPTDKPEAPEIVIFLTLAEDLSPLPELLNSSESVLLGGIDCTITVTDTISDKEVVVTPRILSRVKTPLRSQGSVHLTGKFEGAATGDALDGDFVMVRIGSAPSPKRPSAKIPSYRLVRLDEDSRLSPESIAERIEKGDLRLDWYTWKRMDHDENGKRHVMHRWKRTVIQSRFQSASP